MIIKVKNELINLSLFETIYVNTNTVVFYRADGGEYVIRYNDLDEATEAFEHICQSVEAFHGSILKDLTI